MFSLSDTIANATTADASELQAILNDIATALTGSMAADGQTPITGQMLGLVSTNPAWSFVADTNTGFGSDSADEAWIKAGGTEVVTVVASGSTVTGTENVTGNFSVATNKFNVTAASGNTTVAGTLGVTGDVAVNTNKFTVAASSGNTVVAGTLGITGTTTAAAINGTAITASGALSGGSAAGTMVATQADQETASSTTTLVSPGRQHFHPAASKAWAKFAGGTGTAAASYNCTTARNTTGSYTITIGNDFSSASYVVVVTLENAAGAVALVGSVAAGSFNISTLRISDAAATDPTSVFVVCYGDL